MKCTWIMVVKQDFTWPGSGSPSLCSWHIAADDWIMWGGKSERKCPQSAKKPLGIKRIESFISSLLEKVQYCKNKFDLVDGRAPAKITDQERRPDFSHPRGQWLWKRGKGRLESIPRAKMLEGEGWFRAAHLTLTKTLHGTTRASCYPCFSCSHI